jgi:hypothetical protein
MTAFNRAAQLPSEIVDGRSTKRYSADQNENPKLHLAKAFIESADGRGSDSGARREKTLVSRKTR